MAENIKSDSSRPPNVIPNYRARGLDTILALWNLLIAIENLKDPDKRDTAESLWMDIVRAFLE